MAKLVSVVLLSALLVIMVTASSAYRTIITTFEVDEANPERREDCRREVQEQDLSACERYLRSPDEKEEVVEMPTTHKNGERECCSQVRNVKNECQCEAIRSVFERAKREAERQEYPGVVVRGSRLPSSCGVRDCRVSSSHF